MPSFLIGLSCNLPTKINPNQELYVADLTYCLASLDDSNIHINSDMPSYLYLSDTSYTTVMYSLFDKNNEKLDWNDAHYGHASPVLIHEINWKKQYERYCLIKLLSMTG